MNARKPVMLVGAPGTTKTATIRSMAKEMGYELITIVASRMDAQDISGFPTKGEVVMTTPDGKDHKAPITEYAPQYWQHEIMEHKKVILFLDEWGNAHPSVQASLLSFIQDRQFPNGEYFPPETILVGAMNPTDSGADGYELSKASTNRVTFINWRPDDKKWFRGMLDNFGEGVQNEDEKNWRSRIVRFLNDEPRFIHMENDQAVNTGEALGVDMSDSSNRLVVQSAWASRRSWDSAARILAFSDRSTEAEDLALLGTVGARATQAFRAWLMKHSDLNVQAIISNPRGTKIEEWKKFSLDELAVIIHSALDSFNKDTYKKVLEIFTILTEADRQSDAVAYLDQLAKSFPTLAKSGMSRDDFNKSKAQFVKVLGQYRDFSNSGKKLHRKPVTTTAA